MGFNRKYLGGEWVGKICFPLTLSTELRLLPQICQRCRNSAHWPPPSTQGNEKASSVALAQLYAPWKKTPRLCHHLELRNTQARPPPTGAMGWTGSLILEHFLYDIPDLNYLPARLLDLCFHLWIQMCMRECAEIRGKTSGPAHLFVLTQLGSKHMQVLIYKNKILYYFCCLTMSNWDIVLKETLDTIVWLLKFFYLFIFLILFFFNIHLPSYYIYIQYHFICYYWGCKHSKLQKVWLKQKISLSFNIY